MLDLYADYDYDERKDIIALEAAEIECERSEILYRSYAKLADLKIKEAALQAAMEGADLETLCEYYDEAADGTDEKKQGLLSKAWDAIKNLLKKIKETLFGKQVKGGTVSKTEHSFMQALKENGNALLSKIKANPFASVGAIAAAVVVLFKIVKHVRKNKGADSNGKQEQVKVSEEEAKSFKKIWDNVVGSAHNLLSKVKPETSEAASGDQKNTNLFRTYIQSLISGGKGIISKLSGDKKNDSSDQSTEDTNGSEEGNKEEKKEEEAAESYDDLDEMFGQYYDESADDKSDAVELDPAVESVINSILGF